jgi:Flp pilus assembly protein TadG
MALMLPVLVAIVIAVAQFAVAFNNYITLTDATRAGARKAAVSRFLNDNGAAATAAVYASATSLTRAQLNVDVTASPGWSVAGGDVTVTATYPYSINILGWTVKSGNLTSSTTERLE